MTITYLLNWLPSAQLVDAIPLHRLLPILPLLSLPPQAFECTALSKITLLPSLSLPLVLSKTYFLTTLGHKKATRCTFLTLIILWLLPMSLSMRTLPSSPLSRFLRFLSLHLLRLAYLPSWSFLIPSFDSLFSASSLLSFSSCLLNSTCLLFSRYRDVVPLFHYELVIPQPRFPHPSRWSSPSHCPLQGYTSFYSPSHFSLCFLFDVDLTSSSLEFLMNRPHVLPNFSEHLSFTSRLTIMKDIKYLLLLSWRPQHLFFYDTVCYSFMETYELCCHQKGAWVPQSRLGPGLTPKMPQYLL